MNSMQKYTDEVMAKFGNVNFTNNEVSLAFSWLCYIILGPVSQVLINSSGKQNV